jgi:gamma-glutamyltranspeptidase
LLFQGHSTTLYDNDQLLDGPLIETPERTRNALIKRNHTIAPVTNTGCVQAVAIDLETGSMTAVSDPRKGGKPAGY